MQIGITMVDLEKRLSKGESLTSEEWSTLYQTKNLIFLGEQAKAASQKRHFNKVVSYIVDRNINYTNICLSGCRFCAFYKKKGELGGYVISEKELEQKIIETKNLGGNQILLQGGLHPDLKIDYYEQLLTFITSFGMHVHGFSPPEVIHISNQSNIPIENVLTRLKKAGLGSIPGGGAEILVDSVRKNISKNKCLSKDWLNVMECAHKSGLRSTATMMYGHAETYRDRIDHMIKLKKLQAKTKGFTAFIPWPFQSFSDSKLQSKMTARKQGRGDETVQLVRRGADDEVDEGAALNATWNNSLKSWGTSAFEYLKTVAISRLLLDNFDNIQASWVTQGGKIAQIALLFGANDMGSTMIEENVVKAAGANNRLSEQEIRALIEDAGFTPVKRDTFYEVIDAK